jgi:predicted RNA-binding protein
MLLKGKSDLPPHQRRLEKANFLWENEKMPEKFYKRKAEEMKGLKKKEVNFWILSGSKENWEKGSAESIWGVKEGLKSSWERLEPGDVLLFYVTSPISGLIGFGRLETRFKQDKPLWPDEVMKNKVIYPYRFEFKIDYLIPIRDWYERKIDISGLRLGYWAGLNFVKDRRKIEKLNQLIKENWNVELPLEEIGWEVKEERIPYKVKELTHKDYEEMLKEIGNLQGFITESEYPMENEKLDVVWRKPTNVIPTRVFEIQIGGDIYHALGKLKHAFDLWNSNIYLITDKETIPKVEKLLKGTFHEISSHLTKITLEEVQKLFSSKKELKELERKFGILKY